MFNPNRDCQAVFQLVRSSALVVCGVSYGKRQQRSVN